MKETILVIEEDIHLLDGMREILEIDDEYHILTAGHGVDGLKLAREHLPDLIICDVMMPRMDGYGVLEELRKDPMTQHIPVIFNSARSEGHDIKHAKALGVDGYITKPFSAEELLDAVAAFLGR